MLITRRRVTDRIVYDRYKSAQNAGPDTLGRADRGRMRTGFLEGRGKDSAVPYAGGAEQLRTHRHANLEPLSS